MSISASSVASLSTFEGPDGRAVFYKRQGTEPPVLSWAITVRNEAVLLEQLLRSLRERTPEAEIVVVDTMSNDGLTPEVAQRYADRFEQYAGPRGDWTEEMGWCDDMAAARTFTFELCSGRWIGWADADDRIPGPEETEELLRLNSRWEPAGEQATESTGEPEGLIELLERVERDHPQIEIFYAPYLYQRDAGGKALTWQERERIVRVKESWTATPWRWAEAAHEVLVPAEGHMPVRATLAHLLWLHERNFTPESVQYSIDRHWDVMHGEYSGGRRTTRVCLYLAAYAPNKAPEREIEFIEAAIEAAETGIDRYRGLLALGQLRGRQGLLQDCLAALGGATALRPDLPDAWFTGAEIWVHAEDWMRAVAWMREGLRTTPGHIESAVAPRHHQVRYPVLLAECLQRAQRLYTKAGRHEEARALQADAVDVIHGVLQVGSLGDDQREATVRAMHAVNELRALEHAQNLADLAQYLCDNDEPLKAIEALKAAPWNVETHPLIVDGLKRLDVVRAHADDEDAYVAWYEDHQATGFIYTPEEGLTDPLPRALWIADWIQANKPDARVLDIGCLDGIVGIPLLERCPGITYTGLDIQPDGLAKFRERAEARGFADRVTLMKNWLHDAHFTRTFDVIIWSEVIEHVPSPMVDLARLSRSLSAEGILFVTTPWGNFDAGHPPAVNAHGGARDNRGHLRVMGVHALLAETPPSLQLVDAHRAPGWNSEIPDWGDSLHAQLRRAPEAVVPTFARLGFVVPAALWDWNGRTVREQGMGASEKTIVQIAEALTPRTTRAAVYGPVPEATVLNGVPYLDRSRLFLDSMGASFDALVVSRFPTWIRDQGECLPKADRYFLWLQDIPYPELTAEIAADYTKVIAVSEWHKKALHELHGVPLDHIEVIYNCIEPELYAPRAEDGPRKLDRFVYCSSPDRGLVKLLELWPLIREALPNAELHVFYGWRGAKVLGMQDSEWSRRYNVMRRRCEELQHQPGITMHGMVPPAELARWQRTSGVWAYPTDFTETCCSTALEVRAAGMVPVCPPLAALSETARGINTQWVEKRQPGDGPEWDSAFVEACVRAAGISEAHRQEDAAFVDEHFDREALADRWAGVLSGGE